MDARLHPTWASNQGAWWREKGISGLLFYGIVEDLRSAIPLVESNTWEDSGLVKEVRLDHLRLMESGVGRNFLVIPMAPSLSWFTDRTLRSAAYDRFREAGILCRKTGLCGIALDTCSGSAIYDYRRDNLELEGDAGVDLKRSSRDFGRRALRALIREYPKTEILVTAGPLSSSGPLWFSFLEGLVESLGAADTLRIHLVLYDPEHVVPPSMLSEQLRRWEQEIAFRFSAENLRLWRAHGYLSAGLEPVAEEANGEVSLRMNVEEMREQTLAAKVCSPYYAVVHAPRGGWWTLTAEDAAGYAESHIRGVDLLRPSGPLPEVLGPWTFAAPLDDYRRIGPMRDALLGDIFVFEKEQQGAVLAWQGWKTDWTVETEAKLLRVTEVRSGTVRETVVEHRQAVLSGMESMALADPLPLQTWGLPAGLWCGTDQPLHAGTVRLPIRFGAFNPMGRSIKGTLQLLPPAYGSVGAASFAASMPPQEGTAFERTLQGVFQAGERISLDLVLALRGGEVLRRGFPLEVQPPLDWQIPCDGVPLGPPATGDLDGDGRHEVVIAGGRGELYCLDAFGAQRWVRRYPGNLEGFSGIVRMPDGTPAAVFIDQQGLLRAVDGSGTTVWHYALGAPSMPGMVVATTAPAGGIDNLLIGLVNHRLVCMPVGAPPYWDLPMAGQIGGIAQAGGGNAGNTVRGRVYAALLGSTPALVCLDPYGAEQWRMALDSPPTCGPVLDTMSTPGAIVAVGLRSGTVLAFGADVGEVLWKCDFGTTPIRALRFSEVYSTPGQELLLADDAGVACLDAHQGERWRISLAEVRGLCAAKVAGQPIIGVTTGSGALQFYSGKGELLFRDIRSARGLIGAPLMLDMDQDRRMECLFSSEDRWVRVIELGPAMSLGRFPADPPKSGL